MPDEFTGFEPETIPGDWEVTVMRGDLRVVLAAMAPQPTWPQHAQDALSRLRDAVGLSQ